MTQLILGTWLRKDFEESLMDDALELAPDLFVDMVGYRCVRQICVRQIFGLYSYMPILRWLRE